MFSGSQKTMPLMPTQRSSYGERIQQKLVTKALIGATRIKTLIHLVKLSGDYSYKDITERIGKQRRLSSSEMKVRSNMPDYLIMTYLNFKGYNLTIYYYPQTAN
jgi:hypothetical protein